MLGRGMDDHVAVLAGQGKGHLPFEIEMLLTADLKLGAELVWRGDQRLLGLAAQQGRGGLHVGFLCQCRLDIENGLVLFDVDHGAFGGVTGRVE